MDFSIDSALEDDSNINNNNNKRKFTENSALVSTFQYKDYDDDKIAFPITSNNGPQVNEKSKENKVKLYFYTGLIFFSYTIYV